MRIFLFGIVMLFVGAAGALFMEPVLPDSARDWISVKQEKVEERSDSIKNVLEEVESATKSDVPAILELILIDPYVSRFCEFVNCETGPLYKEWTESMNFTLAVEAVNPDPGVGYTVFLKGIDGHLHDSVSVEWTKSDLDPVPVGERSRSRIDEIENRKIRDVRLEISYDDRAIPAFVSDYNREFVNGLDRYEREQLKKIEAPAGGGISIAGATFNPEVLLTLEDDPYAIPQDKIQDIVDDHFVIGIAKSSEFVGADPDER